MKAIMQFLKMLGTTIAATAFLLLLTGYDSISYWVMNQNPQLAEAIAIIILIAIPTTAITVIALWLKERI